MSYVMLFRPVGLSELELIFDSNCRRFPPRRPEQPFFYPVLNQAYADQIAREWNAPSPHSQFSGYVTEIRVSPTLVSRYETKIVGNSTHAELWIPAEQLAEFNEALLAPIEVTKAYFGQGFAGFMPQRFGLAMLDIDAQLVLLTKLMRESTMDFDLEIGANKKAIFLNFAYWKGSLSRISGTRAEERRMALDAIENSWSRKNIPCHLPRAGEWV